MWLKIDQQYCRHNHSCSAQPCFRAHTFHRITALFHPSTECGKRAVNILDIRSSKKKKNILDIQPHIEGLSTWPALLDLLGRYNSRTKFHIFGSHG